MTRRRTQRDRILSLLQERRGCWIPAYELARLALQYGARVAELRAGGPGTENRLEHDHGQTRSFYRLVLPAGQQALFPGAGVGGAKSL